MAGSFVNRLGVKITLSFGGLGYVIYAAALLVSKYKSGNEFGIFAGALLGVCAGLLWAAQGTIMLSYPNEDEKGRSFAWFWAIFNMGGVVGSLIAFGMNMKNPGKEVTYETYVAFIVLMFAGAVLALFLCNAENVIRSDGTRVVLMKNPSWTSEIFGLYVTIRDEPYILLLFPMFFASNWFTTYQTNGVNGAYFNIRTRSLNSVLYWSSQIIGALITGYCLDVKSFRRSVRAKASLVALVVLTFAIWGGGFAWQKGYTRETAKADADWTDKGYLGPMFLYMFYGFYDSVWQGCVYWFVTPSFY